MQTLAAEIALTFVDDATALMSGGVRIVVRFLMSPIERLANACDVAGVLPSSRPARPGQDNAAANAAVSSHRRRRRMFSFHLLNHLT
jgi:hypothetical protein